MPVATLNGTELYFDDRGEGNAKSRSEVKNLKGNTKTRRPVGQRASLTLRL